jgi:hypothetical protein
MVIEVIFISDEPPQINNPNITSGITSFSLIKCDSSIKPFEGVLPNRAIILKEEDVNSPEFIENISSDLFSYQIVSFHKTETRCLVEAKMKPILYCEKTEVLSKFSSRAFKASAKETVIRVVVPEILNKHKSTQDDNGERMLIESQSRRLLH